MTSNCTPKHDKDINYFLLEFECTRMQIDQ